MGRIRVESREWRSLLVWGGPGIGTLRFYARASTVLVNVGRPGERRAPRVVRVWRRGDWQVSAWG